jgi:hypothetical protein
VSKFRRPKDLGQLIVTLAAAAVGLEPDRIATLVQVPRTNVDGWIGDLRRAKTIEAIRNRMTGHALMPAVAAALGIGVETLRPLLSGRAHRTRGRAAQTKYPEVTEQMLDALGLDEAEFLRLGGFKDTATAFYRENMKQHRQPQKLPRCNLVREVVIKRHHRASSDVIIGILEKQGIEWVTFPKQIPEFLAQHARLCESCRPGVAYDLRHVSKLAVSKIVAMLVVSTKTAVRDIRRGNDFIHQWEYRLSMWPDMNT